MPTCSNCGEENSERARFCQGCGRPLAPKAVPRETRKTVTIVFTDVAGSVSLAEKLDPESVRSVMVRYFDAMRTVLERHGGTVEKFIGDAVMAVFGIPVVHEDDALRAVRAAAEMRRVLEGLNTEFERDLGITIQIRTGVNTGEVVAGDPGSGQSLAIGDAVNVAARLEQAAVPGEILIGEVTHRLVREVVAAQPLESLSLKGKEQPVRAYRLLDAVSPASGQARRADSAIVDREREMAALAEGFGRARSEGTCRVLTMLGTPGVGKSRLVEEFLVQISDQATVLRGRCLPYGEGITFFPIAETVDDALGLEELKSPVEARARIANVLADEEQGSKVADRLAQAIGMSHGVAAPEETFWAIRRFFEALAKKRPLVVVFDDVHWGEVTFLDLLEHLADWSRGAPILLICLARPELLDIRPDWIEGRPNASSIPLEPLAESDCELLVRNLLGSAELEGRARARVIEASEGNPFFVEEMLSMLMEEGLIARDDGHWVPTVDLTTISIPPTISSVLAARLDLLDRHERTVIERASVVGQVFSVRAVRELTSEAPDIDLRAKLDALVRKQLLLPARTTLPAEETFRFRHILIRDAAYESISKRTRAAVHERYAEMLEHWSGPRIEEHEEIIGYHLEQAHRYFSELGSVDDHTRELASRAGRLFADAGRRAFARGDMPATANLLGRAVALLPPLHPSRPDLMPDLAESLLQIGSPKRAASVVHEMLSSSEHLDDPSLQARARLWWSVVQSVVDPKSTSVDQLRNVAEDAARVFEELGEPANIASALAELAWTYWLTGDSGLMMKISQRAMQLASDSGNRLALTVCAEYAGRAMVLGSTPCEEGVRLMAALQGAHADDRLVVAPVQLALAVLLAMMGRFDEARNKMTQAQRVFEDLGQRRWVAAAAGTSGLITWWQGHPEAAELDMRSSYEFFRERGESAPPPEASNLARLLYELDRLDEADTVTETIVQGSPAYQLESQIEWRGVRAKILARRGETEAAEKLAREAVDLARPTDFLSLIGRASLDLAECLHLAGQVDEAERVARDSLESFQRKGDTVGAARARALRELVGRPPSR